MQDEDKSNTDGAHVIQMAAGLGLLAHTTSAMGPRLSMTLGKMAPSDGSDWETGNILAHATVSSRRSPGGVRRSYLRRSFVPLFPESISLFPNKTFFFFVPLKTFRLKRAEGAEVADCCVIRNMLISILFTKQDG